MAEAAAVQQEPVVLLGREAFVDRLCSIVDVSAAKRRSLCFAINGGWGVGKSFVLSRFEQQASQQRAPDSDMPRYLILRYNCWEYDYYAEPLVAIVAAMLDEIGRQVGDTEAEKRTKLIATLKAIGVRLLKSAAQSAASVTGIPLGEIIEAASEEADAEKQKQEQTHAFDEQYQFKKILQEFRELIASLAQEQTVVFLVDELDRCLPEYTIRVLERIHHLVYKVENVQVIFSIDKSQLEHAVHQIYGSATDTNRYLRKFISFEMHLEAGTVSDQFDALFGTYAQHFAPLWSETDGGEAAAFKSMILEGLDMRTRSAIVEKCELLHEMIVTDEKSDESLSCVELFLAVVHQCGIDLQWAKQHFMTGEAFEQENLWKDAKAHTVPEGLRQFNAYCSRHPQMCTRFKSVPETLLNRSTVYTDTVYGMVLAAYRRVLGFLDDSWAGSPEEHVDALVSHAEALWSLLRVID